MVNKGLLYALGPVLIFLLVFLFSGMMYAQSRPYASKCIVQDSLEVSFYSSTMFRLRVSHLKPERFPPRYEIPFAIGHTSYWDPVHFSFKEYPKYFALYTDSLEIRIEKPALNLTVFNKLDGRKVHPSSGPVYGMFRNGYTIFDNASAFDAPSKISRYSHWFFNTNTGRYTDTYLEGNFLEDTYFIYGPSYRDLYRQLNMLIGPEPLLPKKAYGFLQTQHLACNGSQSELMNVVTKFREKKIPLDVVILDFEWGDGCDGNEEVKWGSRLDWSRNYSTPYSPATMLKKLDSLNVDVMLIHHSAGDFRNRKEQGWTESIYTEEEWWGKYIEKLEIGVRGSWQDTRINDVTDSYIYQRTQQYYGPSKRVLFLGSRKVMAFNPWDHRFSVMPTENMIGARRYPFHWTEDCSFSWNEMAFQLRAINNTWGSMSGYSYLASDVIGADWKIQARWSQFAALSAIARSHNSKPWSGNIDLEDFKNKIKIQGRDTVSIGEHKESDQHQTAESSIRKYLQLRYRLLPYIYSYAIECYVTGMPITRPLVLAFPNDYMCSSDTWPYQYMLGEFMLVAPVYGDFKTMEIYLPAGNDWIDFESGDEYQGGGIITYNTEDVNRLPVFIKKGAIIPMRQSSNWIDTAVPDSLTINVYPSDQRSEFDLLEDDGESIEYQNGYYGSTKFICDGDGNTIRLSVSAMEGKFKPTTRRRMICFRFHGIVRRPGLIEKNNIKLPEKRHHTGDHWFYEPQNHVVVVNALVDSQHDVNFTIH